ncbi:DUF1254 domain-containing protein [Klebsiella michiganensis]|uniref:DUF1254 domain-containing protein n=1 Tax=Klebsiella michiganensis TaxID=1134687 RepID=UPI0015F98BB6|nr:DUF1214 domain-containing protein [Klebsiella michiganensis]ELI8805247.1 DUF1254 domain-containing protein [Klebsiella michiganensis]MBE0156828.1 DUF1254 domain-containing protein [Klebsiella michiganensis]MBE0165990.1 DUF1254 domain-containing protein [Klebsiella michiganensis]MBE0189938.1 DUF1254 domain-containing protein [Klebsiella michiganensis]MBE0217205.1 DUF1254 domain-containing protein [Klebsiella michiganensis]
MPITRRDFYKLALGSVVGLAVLKDSPTAVAQSISLKKPLPYGAGQKGETAGGLPPEGSRSSVDDFDYQIKYQRAFEAVLWNMPAAAIYSFRRAAFDNLGLKDNDIIAYSEPATPHLEAITANSTTPYITAFTDLQKGPVVLEVPEAGSDGSLYGQIVDAWQLTIADVGPAGLDKGNGGKYLLTPPGYKGTIPENYLHVPSPNFRIAFAFRSVPVKGKSIQDAYHYSKRLRMYFLSEAGHPPTQRFVDPGSNRYPTLPYYDERHFRDLHAVASVEPVREQDKVMMGMLATLGIERGKPFAPDEKTTKAMRQAAIDAWFYMQYWFDNFPKEKLFWPDRHYASLLLADDNNTFSFVYSDRIDLINRAAEYFWCTYMPKALSDSPATQYMMCLADNKGHLLEAGELYKIIVPAKMPVKQFWALTVYNRDTMSFIYSDTNRTTLSSYDLDKMSKNHDGSVTIYVGPAAPKGMENNWIPTSGKRPLPAMRFYGPTDELNSKTFKLPDFEKV